MGNLTYSLTPLLELRGAPVKTGPVNDTEVLIESGLEVGTVVRRSGG